MRRLIAALGTSLALNLSALAGTQPADPLDWDQWRGLPVLDDGRHKPLDTLARETCRKLTGRSSFSTPEAEQNLSPTALYLRMLLDWRGWDHASGPHPMAGAGTRAAYFAHHQPDKWDQADLLRVDHRALRKALGMPEGDRDISPWELSQARIREPQTGERVAFLSWTAKLVREKPPQWTKLQEQALKLADKLFSYQAHRMGNRLYVLPVPGTVHEDWLSVGSLLRSRYDDQTDPTGGMRKAKALFQRARAAYLAGSAQDFNQAATAFITTLQQLGPRLGPYPPQTVIDLELAYNRWAPFRLAWVFTLVALLCRLVSAAGLVMPGLRTEPPASGRGRETRPRRWWARACSAVGRGTLAAGLLAMLTGFALRAVISRRAPVTNLYESVVFMAFGTVVFGLVFGLAYRKGYLLTAAMAVATGALLLADGCPTVLDPSIRPLQPVLRSNFWLAVHVITVMLSYAAFALALAVGNITLGYCLAGPNKQGAIDAQSRFTYKLLQAGVLLLALGTILGAMWADYSWGRFWGWDPKEVWALITLLSYLAVLHARCAGWIANHGLAAWSVICFTMVIMAWYGVNLLHTGLHNYGLGSDTAAYYVFAALLLQLLYVATASAIHLGIKSRLVPAGPTRPHR